MKFRPFSMFLIPSLIPLVQWLAETMTSASLAQGGREQRRNGEEKALDDVRHEFSTKNIFSFSAVGAWQTEWLQAIARTVLKSRTSRSILGCENQRGEKGRGKCSCSTERNIRPFFKLLKIVRGIYFFFLELLSRENENEKEKSTVTRIRCFIVQYFHPLRIIYSLQLAS